MINKISSLTVKGSNPNYKDPKYLTPIKEDIKKLRWWQVLAYDKIKDADFGLIVAFCGSGKSVLEVALAIHDVVQSNYQQKQLIIVPQQHISRGFTGDEEREFISIEVDGKVYDWKIGKDFCGDLNNVIVGLRDWLLADPSTLNKGYVNSTMIYGINAIASHQALGLVWKTLNDVERKKAVHNLTLRVDEAHHISGVFDIDDDLSDFEQEAIVEERTNLGDVCGFIMGCKDKTAKLHLATATPYRGDKGVILSKQVKQKFQTYYLDWIEHFNTLGIENFNLEYEEYTNDPISILIRNLKTEPNEKHLIVIPSTGTKWRKEGKPELEKLLSEIYKVFKEDRILDLVTPSTQDKNKQRLLKEPKFNNGKSQFDVVVTCMLGREGTDWCPCSRLHNTACENSTTLAIQTLGRPFRRFDGKTEIKVYHYVHEFVKPKNSLSKKELLTDRTNALLVCMQMDEMFKPILIPQLKDTKDNNGITKSNKSSSHSPNTLAEVFGDQYSKFRTDLIEEIESLQDKDSVDIDDVIDDLLKRYKITHNVDNVKDACRAVVLRLVSQELKEQGIDATFIRENGFDKIVEKYVSKGSSIFFGNYNKKDWEVIRKIFRTAWAEGYIDYFYTANGQKEPENIWK